ncbi:hypothetical protein [Herbidospora daliensis]|uniref:hypothetical protein n=1 Tax=Herbidospora daliensis TaxID=295585 RepID=UPI0012F840CC|nr:hypothetical protein [Herbidospora daliensis]
MSWTTALITSSSECADAALTWSAAVDLNVTARHQQAEVPLSGRRPRQTIADLIRHVGTRVTVDLASAT